MAVYIASVQGPINKKTEEMHVASAQGAINKEIEEGYVAPAQGQITKKFYPDWELKTGTKLAAGTTTDKYLSPGAGSSYQSILLTDPIKPVAGSFNVAASTYEPGDTSTVYMSVQYWNGSSWVTVASTANSVPDYTVNRTLNWTMSGEIEVTRLKYLLQNTSGYVAFEQQNASGKCTEWWAKG